MDTKKIGEYLKRLRVKAGYTQAYAGNYLNVTDKAISRWESGAGFPEISNFKALAELYGVTVDDILNCNEAVFNGDGVETAVVPDEIPQTEITAVAAGGRKASALFVPVLFFSYLLTAAAYATFDAFEGFNAIVFMLVLSVATCLGVVAVVLRMLGKRIPTKARSVYETVAYSVLCALSLLMIALINGFDDYLDGVYAVTLGYAVVAMLMLMQLLYVLSDFVKKEKTSKILKAMALAVSFIICAIAIVCAAKVGFGFSEVRYNSVSYTLIFVAAAALSSACASMFGNKIYAVTAAVPAAFIIVSAILLITGANLGIYPELYFTQTNPPTEIWLLIALPAAVFPYVGLFAESKNCERVVKPVLAAVSFALLVPLFVYSWDVFIAGTELSDNYRDSYFLVFRIIVLAVAMARCVVDFVSVMPVRKERRTEK